MAFMLSGIATGGGSFWALREVCRECCGTTFGDTLAGESFVAAVVAAAMSTTTDQQKEALRIHLKISHCNVI
ncbi:MAG TPA: hypothetical protein VGM27_21345 [Acidobacteriaceae bacterium]